MNFSAFDSEMHNINFSADFEINCSYDSCCSKISVFGSDRCERHQTCMYKPYGTNISCAHLRVGSSPFCASHICDHYPYCNNYHAIGSDSCIAHIDSEKIACCYASPSYACKNKKLPRRVHCERHVFLQDGAVCSTCHNKRVPDELKDFGICRPCKNIKLGGVGYANTQWYTEQHDIGFKLHAKALGFLPGEEVTREAINSMLLDTAHIDSVRALGLYLDGNYTLLTIPPVEIDVVDISNTWSLIELSPSSNIQSRYSGSDWSEYPSDNMSIYSGSDESDSISSVYICPDDYLGYPSDDQYSNELVYPPEPEFDWATAFSGAQYTNLKTIHKDD